MKRFFYLQWLLLLPIGIMTMLFGIQRNSLGCTLWAVAGNSTMNGGTLIAKNRDGYPNQLQWLKLARPRNQLAYLGLYANNSGKSGVRAGVNECGLVIINAVASKMKLKKKPYTPHLIEKLLSRCTNIPDVLRHQGWFRGSRYLLLADTEKIALVEIGPNGLFTVKTTDNASLYHTNHYIEPGMRFLNPNHINQSSRTRLDVIKKYLASQKKFSFGDFIKISNSQENGSDNSLWRKGRTAASVGTLATWIVWQPAFGKPALYVRLAHPRQKVKEYYFDLNTVFNYRYFKSRNLVELASTNPNRDIDRYR